ncbi:MAG: response regulator [Betaproteobacteria bacterium]
MAGRKSNQVVAEIDAPHEGNGNIKTVLIVDDDQSFRSALADGLMVFKEDLNVYTAEDGEQAIAIVKTTPVDLVITDLRMPAVGGLELALWMNEHRPATPVIVMSAYADTGTVLNLETQGNYFFDKPLDFNNLIRTVRTLLS